MQTIFGKSDICIFRIFWTMKFCNLFLEHPHQCVNIHRLIGTLSISISQKEAIAFWQFWGADINSFNIRYLHRLWKFRSSVFIYPHFALFPFLIPTAFKLWMLFGSLLFRKNMQELVSVMWFWPSWAHTNFRIVCRPFYTVPSTFPAFLMSGGTSSLGSFIVWYDSNARKTL